MVKKALLIAYHYPPVRVSSGLQRTLAFSQYLSEHGWEPIVLSAHPRSYAQTSNDQLKDIPGSVVVKRAAAFDTARHLAFNGRYFSVMALPDRWVSWWFGGVLSGLRLIRKYKPKVLFSTYPIPTAHLIGLTLHKLTGLPWVADFRDSMTEEHYPREPTRWRIYRWIEKKVIKNCSYAIFTTPSAVEMYRNRYPQYSDSKWIHIPNGYNEKIFLEVESELSLIDIKSGPKVLLHSGVIYPNERDPRHFFQAIAEMKKAGTVSQSRLKVVLRATGHDELFKVMLENLGIEDIVKLEEGIGYRDSLAEIMSVDALLLLQSAGCNHQIPAKLYEYFRADKPILALTDPSGDTAKTLREANCNDIAELDSIEGIKIVLECFILKLESGGVGGANIEVTKKYARHHSAKLLAEVFSKV